MREFGGRERCGQLRPRAPGAANPREHRLPRTQVPPAPRGPGLRAELELREVQGPLATPGRDLDPAASSSLGLPAACADRAALPPVPNPPLDFSLPDVDSPHYPGGDHRQRFSSSGQLCGAWAGVGARSAERQGDRARPAPSTGRGAQEAGATRTGTLRLELSPSPRQSARMGFAPPRPLGRGPASRPRARQLGGGSFDRGDWAETKQLRSMRGRGRQETTIPNRSCAGAVEAAGKVGLLCFSPIAWGLPSTRRRCKTEVAE